MNAPAVAKIIVISAAIYIIGFDGKGNAWRCLKMPKELSVAYVIPIPLGEQEEMYRMVNMEVSGKISQEELRKRSSAIYGGKEINIG